MARMTSGMYSSARTDYSTPQPLFNKINGVFRFGLDVCAEEWNTKVPDNYITPEMDGLSTDWHTLRPTGPEHAGREFAAWMNPEYGDQVGPWTARAAEQHLHGMTIVALLAARTDAAWFHENCSKASGILFMRNRVKFLLPCHECGEETDRRRKPSLAKLVALEDAGMDVDDKMSFPLCDMCQAKDVVSWLKKSSNSPAVGSMLVIWGWGKFAWKDAWYTGDLADLGIAVDL